ncbi:MAG: hypothetical protein EOM15_14045, partial [Spirochaetia bacterium]|nr:hypothetical protein [Spirochaetia bacterium]
MKPLALACDVASIDKLSQETAKIPELSLMESAGLQIFQHWKPYLSAQDRLIFLCGGGNNGGDALVVARYAFNEGFSNILLVYTGSRLSPACSIQREIAKAYNLQSIEYSYLDTQHIQHALSKADWVVDGLVGTGLK